MEKKTHTVEILTDPAKMIGLFTAENVSRTWKEDFADEGTGEVVAVVRKEMIVQKGTMIDAEVAAKLAFSIQAGELETVACSHERRAGEMIVYDNWRQYNAKVKLHKKKLNVLLWAQSVSQAFDVLVDWVELNHTGEFIITSVAESDNGVCLNSEKGHDKEEESKIYSMKISVNNEKEIIKLIVVAPNVDMAESIIVKHLEMEGEPTQFMLEEVKVTSIDVIISQEFSLPYTNGSAK